MLIFGYFKTLLAYLCMQTNICRVLWIVTNPPYGIIMIGIVIKYVNLTALGGTSVLFLRIFRRMDNPCRGVELVYDHANIV